MWLPGITPRRADLVGKVDQREHHVAQHAGLGRAHRFEEGILLIAVQFLRGLAGHQAHALRRHDCHVRPCIAEHGLGVFIDHRAAEHGIAVSLALAHAVHHPLGLVAEEAAVGIVLGHPVARELFGGESFVELLVDRHDLFRAEDALDHHAAIAAHDFEQFGRFGAEGNALDRLARAL